tara:strand:- start:357 stop:869 length:513 start_codon:yes stop_codon:yes gene_type:complete
MKRISKAHWIWGQFVDRDMDYLDSIKSCVNEKLKGPNFDIHLTLLGPFMSMDNEKINKIKKICTKLKPIEIFASRYAMTNNFFTSFFIEVKKSTTLINFRNELHSSANKNQFTTFSPHISLTYGNFPRKEKNIIKNDLGAIKMKFILNKICVVNVNEDKFSWKIIKTFVL